ncbi:MAG: hypothetical protein HY721_31040 [Planctomycetes bacterium]|nr:hypothetical protein [Planctomycetota bacterium]
MKTVHVSKRARGIHSLLRQASRQNLILRSPEGREYLVAEIDDFDREIELTRRNKELMRFLDRRAKEKETVPLRTVKASLGMT